MSENRNSENKPMSVNILIIDDESGVREMVSFTLKRQGFNIICAEDSQTGLKTLGEILPDLILLDWMLPDISGVDLARRPKGDERYEDIPIIMLTARGEEDDKIRGLDAGADDYLVKPFDFDELLARIRALLRRKGNYQEKILQYKNIAMDLDGKTVSKDEEPVSLSAREFEILRLLLENAGRCLSREQIEQKIYNWDDEFGSNTVEVHISAIRRKLGKELIKTIRGIGYIVEREA